MAAKNGRNVSLTSENEALVQRLLADGRYASASEVVRDGLRLLERHEHERLFDKWLAEGLTPEEEASLPPGALARARTLLTGKIREGLDSIARGEGVDGDVYFARLRSRLEGRGGRQPAKRRRSA